MTPQEFRDRLNRLGYVDQTQAARALRTAAYNVNRYLSGARPIPGHIERELERLEADPLPVLTAAMATALEQADGPGDPVPVPEVGTEIHLRTVNWPRTFEGMHQLGLVEGEQEAIITERGWRALQRHLDEEETA